MVPDNLINIMDIVEPDASIPKSEDPVAPVREDYETYSEYLEAFGEYQEAYREHQANPHTVYNWAVYWRGLLQDFDDSWVDYINYVISCKRGD